MIFKLLGLVTALLTSLVIYATSQVCDYNSTLDLKKQSMDALKAEIGNTFGGEGIGDMTIKYNKQLDCVAVAESNIDEKNILNQIKEITKVVVAVINKDKLANSSSEKNVELLSTEGKSDKNILKMLKKTSEKLVKKKSEILGEPDQNQTEELDKIMKEYEKLLEKSNSKSN